MRQSTASLRQYGKALPIRFPERLMVFWFFSTCETMTIAHDNSAIEGINAAAAAIHAVSGGIELSGLAGTQVNVFDTLGRLAARVNVEAQTETVALPQGVYVVVTDGGLRVKVTVL